MSVRLQERQGQIFGTGELLAIENLLRRPFEILEPVGRPGGALFNGL